MLVVVAPDKFKGSLSAAEAAEAIGRAVRRELRGVELALRPVADGGQGTVDALLTAVGGRLETVEVTGPLGGTVEAAVGWLNDGRAVIEAASAAGLVLVRTGRRDPLAASSRGVGELIAHVARARRARALIVGVGDTATTDGGTGMARALGYRFLDEEGRDLPDAPRELTRLARIDASGALDLSGLEVTAACDVDNPLLGERGAARVFGPQKGAGPAEVELLEAGLARVASHLVEDLGADLAGVARAGAGGGLGAGLAAFCGARLESGFEVTAAAANLQGLLARAELAITGEGRLDEQTLGGKAPAGVARLAAAAGVRCLAVAGEVTIPPQALRRAGIERAVSLTETVGPERALADPEGAIAEAVRALLAGPARAPGRMGPGPRG